MNPHSDVGPGCTGGAVRDKDASPADVGHCSAAPRSERLAGGVWLDLDISAAEVGDVRTSHLLRDVGYRGRTLRLACLAGRELDVAAR
ncbi:MAG TPA: hypothetical protein VGK55_06805, partial [Actinomycetes bacterium]